MVTVAHSSFTLFHQIVGLVPAFGEGFHLSFNSQPHCRVRSEMMAVMLAVSSSPRLEIRPRRFLPRPARHGSHLQPAACRTSFIEMPASGDSDILPSITKLTTAARTIPRPRGDLHPKTYCSRRENCIHMVPARAGRAAQQRCGMLSRKRRTGILDGQHEVRKTSPMEM